MTRPNIEYYAPNPNLAIDEDLYKTSLEGVYYLDNQVYKDDRGYFCQLATIPPISKQIGTDFSIKQMNLSQSHTNVIRGIHAEGWNKLVSVITGKALCVIADVRPHSSTYKQSQYFLLGKSKDCLTGSLFLPSGIGNSICVLEGPVNYVYAVDKLYQDRDTTQDRAISIFDPELNINWPIPNEDIVLSERDKLGKTLKEVNQN